MPMPSLAGRLLVASPDLADPNFLRTVVLVLAHGEEGALGIVLNRPSEASVAELVPGWSDLAAPPERVFLGGPVGLDAVVGLAQLNEDGDDSQALNPRLRSVGTVDLNRSPEDADAKVEAVRLFAGSAGWGGGQLEGELGERAWFVVDPATEDVFTDDPEHLWRAVLKRQPGHLAWVANAAGNPMFN